MRQAHGGVREGPVAARRASAVGLAALLACLGLLSIAWAVSQAQRSPEEVGDERAAVATLLPEAEWVAADVVRAVRPAMARTRLIASDPKTERAIRSGDPGRLTEVCNESVRQATEIDAVALFDASARMIGMNTIHADGRQIPEDRVSSLLGTSFADLEIVRGCLAEGGPEELIEFQTECRITPACFDSSGLSVALSVPVIEASTGERIGVVSTRMRFERLTEIRRQTRVAGGHGSVELVTDDGRLFREDVNAGLAAPPVPEDALRDLVRPLAGGQADRTLLKLGSDYLGLYSVNLGTLTPGGLHVLLTAPGAWAEGEATLLRRQRAAIAGLIGLLLLSLAGTVAALGRLSTQSRTLRRAQDRFHRAVRGASDGLWDWEFGTNRVWYSPRFRELVGFDPDAREEFPDTFDSWFDRLHPEDRERTMVAIDAHLEEGRPYDVKYRVRTRSGEYRWFRARGEVSREGSGRPVRMAGSIHDITEQVRIEGELRESEARLREERALLAEILSTLPFFVFWKDRESRYLGCNAAFAEAAGLSSPEEIVGRTDFDLPWSEAEARRYRADDEAVMRTGQPKLHVEETQRWRDGRVLTLSASKVPLRSGDGATIGVIGVYVDITERKQLETQLAQAQKLESIGQLAAGIAHEINTPTQFISDNVCFLQDNFSSMLKVIDSYAAQLDPDAPPKSWDERCDEIRSTLEELDYEFLREEIPQALEQTLEGLERVATIIHAMKDFSHPAKAEKEPIDLNKAIESTATVCRNRWKYVADLHLDLERDLPAVDCLAAEINQVILNLIVNAADAIRDAAEGDPAVKGLIRVTTRRRGSAVELRVEDNGPGIPDEIRDRIFDPFFTTKEVGAGTGQGLAICRDVIMQKHGGKLTCRSTPGEGAEFTVTLPIRSAASPGAREAA